MFVTPYTGTPVFERVVRSGLIGDLEAFILRLNDAVNFTINLTDMSDEGLLKLRDDMLEVVREAVPPPDPEEVRRRDAELYGADLIERAAGQFKRDSFRQHRKLHGFNEE